MNITDVGHLSSDADTGEDKMLKGAKREHKTVMEIAKFYTSVLHFISSLPACGRTALHFLKDARVIQLLQALYQFTVFLFLKRLPEPRCWVLLRLVTTPK